MATFLKQYEILFIKAKEDLVAAKYLLDGFNNHNLELNLDIIFFHLQQCAEKLIKTILDFHSIKFPHNHAIRELINIASEHEIKINHEDELSQLTQYAVEGRYAVIHDDLDNSDKYIKCLEELLLFVEEQIK